MPTVRRVVVRPAAPAATAPVRRAPAGPPISQEIAAAIAAAEGNYAKAAPMGSSFIEDGDYQGEIVSAVLAVAQQSRKLMAKFQIRVLSEGAEGAIVWKNSMLESEQNMGYFKGELERISVTAPKSMKAIPAALKSCENKVIDFRAKTSGDGQFQNYYFLGESEEAPAEGQPAAEGEEIIEEAPAEGEEVIEEIEEGGAPAEGEEVIEEVIEEGAEGDVIEEVIEEAPAPAPTRRVVTRPAAAPAPAPVRRVAVPQGVTRRVVVRRPAK